MSRRLRCSRQPQRYRTAQKGQRATLAGSLLWLAGVLFLMMFGLWMLHAPPTAAQTPPPSLPGPGFAGEYQLADNQLYLRARMYDPAQGRFMQRDPLDTGRAALGWTAAANRYGYAASAPTTWVDPSGHNPEVPVITFDPDLSVPGLAESTLEATGVSLVPGDLATTNGGGIIWWGHGGTMGNDPFLISTDASLMPRPLSASEVARMLDERQITQCMFLACHSSDIARQVLEQSKSLESVWGMDSAFETNPARKPPGSNWLPQTNYGTPQQPAWGRTRATEFIRDAEGIIQTTRKLTFPKGLGRLIRVLPGVGLGISLATDPANACGITLGSIVNAALEEIPVIDSIFGIETTSDGTVPPHLRPGNR